MLSTKCVNKLYIFMIYMYKEDLALNNLQCLICHKTKPNQTKPNICFLLGKLICLLQSWKLFSFSFSRKDIFLLFPKDCLIHSIFFSHDQSYSSLTGYSHLKSKDKSEQNSVSTQKLYAKAIWRLFCQTLNIKKKKKKKKKHTTKNKSI